MPETLLTDSVDDAAAVIRRGGTAAFPTETVYGLGANAFHADAVAGVFRAKGRPADNPLIVHVARKEDIETVVATMSTDATRLITAFFPGPLTLVLPKREQIPSIVSAGLETVAVRMPAHPQALALIRAAGVPLVAPSANRSGRPSPTTWQAVQEDLDGRIDAILRGAPTAIGLESTVVDATGDVPVVLRLGAVSLEDLKAVVPSIEIEEGVSDRPARSPGLKYRHYAPSARVVIVRGPADLELSPRTAYIGLDPPEDGFALVEVCTDTAAYAQRLYDFFRRCDAAGLETIFAQAVPEIGLGRALMDRLRRAAESP